MEDTEAIRPGAAERAAIRRCGGALAALFGQEDREAAADKRQLFFL